MINKFFLISLLSGLSCAAYAVSENFEISTTIDHEVVLGNFRSSSSDVDLKVTADFDMGTIVVDPNQQSGGVRNIGGYDPLSGRYGGVVSVSNTSRGTISANIPNPAEDDSRISFSPNPLHFGGVDVYLHLYYTSTRGLYLYANIEYSGGVPEEGHYSENVTITYHPE
ncbi:MAG: hypothetical protein IJ689_07485 [Alphaproteobacteria bacterium]|nr:hypothetical protein [Alphaproteobacteria bacterium]